MTLVFDGDMDMSAEDGEDAVAELLVERKDGTLLFKVPLTQEGSWTIGSSGACDIVIKEPGVSSAHAKLTAGGVTPFTLADLGSTNKTKMNNICLEEHQPVSLSHGAKAMLATVRIQLNVFPPKASRARGDGTPQLADEAGGEGTPVMPGTPDLADSTHGGNDDRGDARARSARGGDVQAADADGSPELDVDEHVAHGVAPLDLDLGESHPPPPRAETHAPLADEYAPRRAPVGDDCDSGCSLDTAPPDGEDEAAPEAAPEALAHGDAVGAEAHAPTLAAAAADADARGVRDAPAMPQDATQVWGGDDGGDVDGTDGEDHDGPRATTPKAAAGARAREGQAAAASPAGSADESALSPEYGGMSREAAGADMPGRGLAGASSARKAAQAVADDNLDLPTEDSADVPVGDGADGAVASAAPGAQPAGRAPGAQPLTAGAARVHEQPALGGATQVMDILAPGYDPNETQFECHFEPWARAEEAAANAAAAAPPAAAPLVTSPPHDGAGVCRYRSRATKELVRASDGPAAPQGAAFSEPQAGTGGSMDASWTQDGEKQAALSAAMHATYAARSAAQLLRPQRAAAERAQVAAREIGATTAEPGAERLRAQGKHGGRRGAGAERSAANGAGTAADDVTAGTGTAEAADEATDQAAGGEQAAMRKPSKVARDKLTSLHTSAAELAEHGARERAVDPSAHAGGAAAGARAAAPPAQGAAKKARTRGSATVEDKAADVLAASAAAAAPAAATAASVAASASVQRDANDDGVAAPSGGEDEPAGKGKGKPRAARRASTAARRAPVDAPAAAPAAAAAETAAEAAMPLLEARAAAGGKRGRRPSAAAGEARAGEANAHAAASSATETPAILAPGGKRGRRSSSAVLTPGAAAEPDASARTPGAGAAAAPAAETLARPMPGGKRGRRSSATPADTGAADEPGADEAGSDAAAAAPATEAAACAAAGGKRGRRPSAAAADLDAVEAGSSRAHMGAQPGAKRGKRAVSADGRERSKLAQPVALDETPAPAVKRDRAGAPGERPDAHGSQRAEPESAEPKSAEPAAATATGRARTSAHPSATDPTDERGAGGASAESAKRGARARGKAAEPLVARACVASAPSTLPSAAEPTSAPALARRHMRVLFTCFDDTQHEARLQKVIGGLGAIVVESAEEAHTCELCVVDEQCLKRTVKLLIAISSGARLVHPAWVTTCEQAGALLAADDFWLHGTYSSGARSSAHWSFDADDVFARASRAKCLSGLTLMLSKNVQPPPKQMALIIESAGGKVAKRLPPAPSGEEQSVYFAVLALPQDKGLAASLKEQGHAVIGPESLLLAVMRHDRNALALSSR